VSGAPVITPTDATPTDDSAIIREDRDVTRRCNGPLNPLGRAVIGSGCR
jgi:hypothetical protein